MDDLDALFQQLEEVQEQQAAIRLSERMVVDLVDKLKSLGLFNDGLLHTTNGREYMTTSQVTKEIEMALEQCGGRVALVDLPGLLNVDYSHCSAQADVLIQEAAGRVSLVNGDLFSENFFRSMALELNELLRTAPALELSEIARQFALPADQVISCVRQHLSTLIEDPSAATLMPLANLDLYKSMKVNQEGAGSLEGHTLYMPSFLLIAKAFLRGTLRAATTPVSISGVLKSQPFPHSSAVTNKLAVTLVQELVSEGAIKGTFRPSGLMFTPEAFRRSRIDAIQSFYHRNRYVDYSMVKNWGISQPQEFLREHCADGLELHSVHASHSITAELDASLAGGLPSSGFMDVREFLPENLEKQDIEKLVANSKSVHSCLQSNARLVSGIFLVSEELLVKANAVAKKAGADSAESDLTAGKRAVPLGKSGAASASTGDHTGRRLKGGKGKAKKNAQSVPATIEAGAESDAAASHMASAVRRELVIQYNIGSEKLPEELAAAVSQSIAGVALQAYEDRLHSGLSTGSQAEQNTALQEVNCLQQQAALHLRGLRTLIEVSGAAAAAADSAEGGKTATHGSDAVHQFSGLDVREQISILEEHLLQSLLLPAAHAALRYTAVHVCACVDIEELDSGDMAQQCHMILDRLPAGLKSDAQAVVAVLEEPNHLQAALDNLLGKVDALLTATGAHLLSRGRAIEQQLVDASCEVNRQVLHRPCAALAAALAGGIVCLLGENFHVLVLAPGRSLRFIIRCLRKFLKNEETEFLEGVHREVIQSLRRKQKAGEEPGRTHETLISRLAILCHTDVHTTYAV